MIVVVLIGPPHPRELVQRHVPRHDQTAPVGGAHALGVELHLEAGDVCVEKRVRLRFSV